MTTASPALPDYVAAFRTYAWDDDIALLARRFFAACPSGRQLVLADETRGPLGITGYEVVSHTSDLSALGLIDEPRGNALWFNVDYGLFALRQACPGYSYYVTSESDLAVNLNLEPAIAAIAARGVDFVAHEIKPAEPDWGWYGTASGLFQNQWRALLFFLICSGRALDALHGVRRIIGTAFTNGQLASWPFCESFVPTVIKLAGLSTAEIGEFAGTTNLKWRPWIPLDAPAANEPGTLAHSVLGRARFCRAIIKEFGVTGWHDPSMRVNIALRRHYSLPDYAEFLREALEEAGDAEGMARLSAALAQ